MRLSFLSTQLKSVIVKKVLTLSFARDNGIVFLQLGIEYFEETYEENKLNLRECYTNRSHINLLLSGSCKYVPDIKEEQVLGNLLSYLEANGIEVR